MSKVKTKGVVISTTKYKDTSIIVRVFTQELGLRSYIVNGVRSSKAKGKIAKYQPLTLLDMVVYDKGNSGLQRIVEDKIDVPFSSIPFEIHKTLIAQFLAELLSKVLKEETENDDLFVFIYESIKALDLIDGNAENFHLIFMLKLADILGFGIGSSEDIKKELSYFRQEEYTEYIDLFIGKSYLETIVSNRSIRNTVLNLLLKFYQIQFEGFHTMKSPDILRAIFD